mmetsp:Transcript_33690/g.72698  ORF Transcript_33690/g.72698 Transcript_33690/m.72698 type:complete len:222 (-) Transcript_33690:593-1258(-)
MLDLPNCQGLSKEVGGRVLDHLKEGFFRHEQVLQQNRRYDNSSGNCEHGPNHGVDASLQHCVHRIPTQCVDSKKAEPPAAWQVWKGYLARFKGTTDQEELRREAAPVPRTVGKEVGGQENQADGIVRVPGHDANNESSDEILFQLRLAAHRLGVGLTETAQSEKHRGGQNTPTGEDGKDTGLATLDLLYGPRVEVNEEHHERQKESKSAKCWKVMKFPDLL